MRLHQVMDKIHKMDKKIKYIIFLISALIALSIVTGVLKRLSNEETWNFNELYEAQDIEDVIYKLDNEDDRNIHWTLYSIVDKYISNIIASAGNEKMQNEQYGLLLKQYRKVIDKRKYSSLCKDIAYRFMYKNADDEYMKLNYYIENIYVCEENTYLCHLKVDTSAMSENDLSIYYGNENEDIVREVKSEGYIGIRLNVYKSTYEIFYVE